MNKYFFKMCMCLPVTCCFRPGYSSECRDDYRLSFWGPFWIPLKWVNSAQRRTHEALWEWQPACLSSVRCWILSYNLSRSFIVTEEMLDLFSHHSFWFELSFVKDVRIKMGLLLSNSSERIDIRAYRMVLVKNCLTIKSIGVLWRRAYRF